MNETKLRRPILLDGRIFQAGSVLDVSDEALAQGEKNYERAIVRRAIERAAGDAGTREGVMSDVLAMLLVGLAEVIEKLAGAKTVEQVREAAVPLEPFAKAVREARASGLVFPFEAKGLSVADVVKDLKAVSAGVTSGIKRG